MLTAFGQDRPAMPDSQTFLYDVKYAGKSVADKLAEIQPYMNKAEADHLILTKIDEIAWLLNLRAKDIPVLSRGACVYDCSP